jgi:hypothetical protein
MGSTPLKAGRRTLYFLPHERAMAHYSYASPDRKWALIVEMDRTGTESLPALPLDGTWKAGKCPAGFVLPPVGPRTGSGCISAPQPKGRRFNALHPFGAGIYGASGSRWNARTDLAPPRRRASYCAGRRFLITSVGVRRSEIWIHDAGNDRPLSSEDTFGAAISAVGKCVLPDAQGSDSELLSVDLSSGKTEHLLPGSSSWTMPFVDESEVAYHAKRPGVAVWVTALIAALPRRDLRRRPVSFGANGDLTGLGKLTSDQARR